MAGKIVVIVLLFATLAGAGVWWFVDMKGAPDATAAELPDVSTAADADPMVHAAITDAREAARTAPDDDRRREATMTLGMTFHAHSMLDEAATCYDVVLADLEVPGARYHRARIDQVRGNLDRAVSGLQRVIANAPSYLPARVRLATVLLELGRNDDAIGHLRDVLDVDADQLGARVELARALLTNDEVAEAQVMLESVVRDYPGVEYFHQLLGTALQRNGDMERARLHLAAASGSPPAFDDPWVRHVQQLQTGFNAMLERAASFIDAGDGSAALEILQPLRTDHPDSVLVLNYMSSAYVLEGNEDKADQMLQLALSRDNASVMTHVNLSLAAERRARMGDALDAARKAIALDAESGPAHRQLGRLLAIVGQHEDAATALAKAMRCGAGDPDTALLHAQLLSVLGQWREAERAYARLCSRLPDHASALAGHARTLLELGRLDEGQRLLQQAMSINADDPVVQSTRARLGELTP